MSIQRGLEIITIGDEEFLFVGASNTVIKVKTSDMTEWTGGTSRFNHGHATYSLQSQVESNGNPVLFVGTASSTILFKIDPETMTQIESVSLTRPQVIRVFNEFIIVGHHGSDVGSLTVLNMNDLSVVSRYDPQVRDGIDQIWYLELKVINNTTYLFITVGSRGRENVLQKLTIDNDGTVSFHSQYGETLGDVGWFSVPMTFSSNGTIFVFPENGDILEIDPANLQKIRTIKGIHSDSVRDYVVNKDDNTVFYTVSDDNTVKITTITLVQDEEVEIDSSKDFITLEGHGHHIFVLDSERNIFKFDVSNEDITFLSVIPTKSESSNPTSMAIDTNTRNLYTGYDNSVVEKYAYENQDHTLTYITQYNSAADTGVYTLATSLNDPVYQQVTLYTAGYNGKVTRTVLDASLRRKVLEVTYDAIAHSRDDDSTPPNYNAPYKCGAAYDPDARRLFVALQSSEEDISQIHVVDAVRMRFISGAAKYDGITLGDAPIRPETICLDAETESLFIATTSDHIIKLSTAGGSGLRKSSSEFAGTGSAITAVHLYSTGSVTPQPQHAKEQDTISIDPASTALLIGYATGAVDAVNPGTMQRKGSRTSSVGPFNSETAVTAIQVVPKILQTHDTSAVSDTGAIANDVHAYVGFADGSLYAWDYKDDANDPTVQITKSSAASSSPSGDLYAGEAIRSIAWGATSAEKDSCRVLEDNTVQNVADTGHVYVGYGAAGADNLAKGSLQKLRMSRDGSDNPVYTVKGEVKGLHKGAGMIALNNTGLTWHPNGFLIAGSASGEAAVCTAEMAIVGTEIQFSAPVNAIAYAHATDNADDGGAFKEPDQLLVALQDGGVAKLDAESLTTLGNLRPEDKHQDGPANAVVVHPGTCHNAYSAGDDGRVKKLDASAGGLAELAQAYVHSLDKKVKLMAMGNDTNATSTWYVCSVLNATSVIKIFMGDDTTASSLETKTFEAAGEVHGEITGIQWREGDSDFPQGTLLLATRDGTLHMVDASTMEYVTENGRPAKNTFFREQKESYGDLVDTLYDQSGIILYCGFSRGAVRKVEVGARAFHLQDWVFRPSEEDEVWPVRAMALDNAEGTLFVASHKRVQPISTANLRPIALSAGDLRVDASVRALTFGEDSSGSRRLFVGEGPRTHKIKFQVTDASTESYDLSEDFVHTQADDKEVTALHLAPQSVGELYIGYSGGGRVEVLHTVDNAVESYTPSFEGVGGELIATAGITYVSSYDGGNGSGEVVFVTYDNGGVHLLNRNNSTSPATLDYVKNFDTITFGAYAVCTDPNGYLYIGINKEVHKVDSASMGKTLGIFRGHTDRVTALVYGEVTVGDQVEKYVFTGGVDNVIIQVNTETMEELTRISSHQGRIRQLIYDTENEFLYSASENKSIKKISPFSSLGIVEIDSLTQDDKIITLAASKGETFLYAGDDKGNVIKVDTSGASMANDSTATPISDVRVTFINISEVSGEEYAFVMYENGMIKKVKTSDMSMQ